MIEYGFEAGNQKMLNIIDKRVTVEQNRQAALWTAQAGIYTSPTLVLAMPGETDKTVSESVDFIKSLSLGYKQYQWSYALPIPGSPLYEFARLSGAVEDEDEYLDSLDGKVAGAGIFHVNLTDEPDEIVASWRNKIRSRIDDAYLRRRYGSRAWLHLWRREEKKVHLSKKTRRVIANKLRSIPSRGASQASERPLSSSGRNKGRFEELISEGETWSTGTWRLLINARLKTREETRVPYDRWSRLANAKDCWAEYSYVPSNVPGSLSAGQKSAREEFLEEIDSKELYIPLERCPYCGNETCTQISETDARGLPCDIAVCDACGGCF
jgi:hypothetical protein